ncbi:hypothetical protein SAMD00019534_082730 [Acytostelium subglobosum LB1]|uniref:hypothetical protein n=1 Tax=Acytostelium subglobosum LB1 TaxID=1410327 RepID=UPI000644FCFA|nr:hypothetical protein SAMD00019534_082730 [Acytostelium subglobosum LB1]GAM25098.1 hypothetical protein SAMD00019534_082730 [Acytostelium subglobosum LB1]|eukprot:XP_012752187.1 hypothetical protein SAMD00019534_082730 [Acytostelium subglobosum LB1]
MLLYNQYKKASIAKLYKDSLESLDHSNTFSTPSLSPMLIKQIIEHILTIRNDSLDSKWVVSLSTVCIGFHQAVSSVISNHVTPSLNIGSMINHIGSKYCLFTKAPLHLNALDLPFLPPDHIEQCLDSLQSLTVPFDFGGNSGESIIFINVRRQPNLRYICFMEVPDYIIERKMCKLSEQNSQEPYSVVKIQMDGDGVSDYHSRCFIEMFRVYVDDHPTLQDIEIHSNSPAGPPALSKLSSDAGTRLNFIWAHGALENTGYYNYICRKGYGYDEYDLLGHMDENELDHITFINMFKDHPVQNLYKAKNVQQIILKPSEYATKQKEYSLNVQRFYEGCRQLKTLSLVVTELEFILPLIPAQGTAQTLQLLEIYVDDWISISKDEIGNTIHEIITKMIAIVDQPNLMKITVRTLNPSFIYLSFYRCCPKCPLKVAKADNQSILISNMSI